MEKRECVAHLKLMVRPILEFNPIGYVKGIHIAEDWRGFQAFILRDDGDIRE